MNILFAAAEVAPLTKVGGLADVIRSLPAQLIKRGHDVRIVVPRYGFVDYSQYSVEPVISGLTLYALQEYRTVSVDRIIMEGIPVYLISCDIFDSTLSVYGDDEVTRFFIFCEAVVEALPCLGWKPEIIHCHDWHTALLPLLLRTRRPDYRTVLTIHNIRYQGNIDEFIFYRSGLSRYWQSSLAGGPVIPWNFMAQGILWAHAINAVSENFAREILTPGGGFGLQDILTFRQNNLTGIINGLGEEEFDPSADGLIPAIYSHDDIKGKSVNKLALQEAAGWEPAPEVPLVGMVSRLDEQKGLDIIIRALPRLLNSTETEMQFVFLGNGKQRYERGLIELASRFPGRIKAFITYDNRKAHLIYAGSDMFLMPSHWEPCGLSQLIAMRYGTVPIVRKTGGLADTVSALSSDLQQGNGFVFEDYHADALAESLKMAAAAFGKQQHWWKLIKRIMQQDFSWRIPVDKYEALYQKVLRLT